MPIGVTAYRQQIGRHTPAPSPRLNNTSDSRYKTPSKAPQRFIQDLHRVEASPRRAHDQAALFIPRPAFSAGTKWAMALGLLQLAGMAGAFNPHRPSSNALEPHGPEPTRSHSVGLGHRHHPQPRLLPPMSRRKYRRDVTTLEPETATLERQNTRSRFRKVFPPVDPPPAGRVWRVDMRDPDEIFATGFSAIGGNRDLLRHVQGSNLCPRTGLTLQERANHYELNSGFISTTASEDIGRQIAQGRLRPSPGEPPGIRTIWIYEIQPSSQFFSTAHSIHHAHHNIATCPNRTVEVNIRLNRLTAMRDLAIAEQEWVAYGRIPSSQIVRATQYRLAEDGSLEAVTGSGRTNDNFAEGACATASSTPWQYVGSDLLAETLHREPLAQMRLVDMPPASSPTERNTSSPPARRWFSTSFCACFGESSRHTRSLPNALDNAPVMRHFASAQAALEQLVVDETLDSAPPVVCPMPPPFQRTKPPVCHIPPSFQQPLRNKASPGAQMQTAGTCESPSIIDMDWLWKNNGYAWQNNELIETHNNGILWKKHLRLNRSLIVPEQCIVRIADDMIIADCIKNPHFKKYRLLVLAAHDETPYSYLATGKTSKPLIIFITRISEAGIIGLTDSLKIFFADHQGQAGIIIAPELPLPERHEVQSSTLSNLQTESNEEEISDGAARYRHDELRI